MSDDKSDLYDKYLRNLDPKEYERQKKQVAEMEELRVNLYQMGNANLSWAKKDKEEINQYAKWFMAELDTFPEVVSKLRFVMETENQVFTLKQEAIGNQHHYQIKHCQDLLDIIITPWKAYLRKSLELEKELAAFMPTQKVTMQEPVAEIKQKEDTITQIEPVKPQEEIKHEVPEVEAVKTKKVEAGKKLEWSDPRIPELLTDLFLEAECIFKEEKKMMQTFLETGNSPAHIRWRKKGNILTTSFYDLKRNGYLQAQQDYIAEKIEKNIFSSSETLKPISTKDTIKASFSPGLKSVKKRAHKDDPDYLDVVTYLREKLQSPA